MMGHLIAAAGVTELILCLLAIRDNVLPATINYENPDPDCDLDYIPNTARSTPVDYALNNSFGFGGHNVTLLLGRRAWKALRSVMVGVNVLLVVAIAAFGVLVFSHRPRDAEVTPPYLPLATLLLIPVGTIHLLRTVPKAAAGARDEVEPSGVIDP